jgi:hypothetical protein
MTAQNVVLSRYPSSIFAHPRWAGQLPSDVILSSWIEVSAPLRSNSGPESNRNSDKDTDVKIQHTRKTKHGPAEIDIGPASNGNANKSLTLLPLLLTVFSQNQSTRPTGAYEKSAANSSELMNNAFPDGPILRKEADQLGVALEGWCFFLLFRDVQYVLTYVYRFSPA